MERYNQFIEASRSSLGVVLGDLMDVAAWGIVPCVSMIDTLGGGEGGGRGRGGRGGGEWGVRTRLMIRSPVQHVCTLVRLNFV
jgi:hypothetical protein